MRERFVRWLLLNLAVALTLLGRPGSECVASVMQEEALRAETADTSLMSEERRVPGLKSTGDGVRSSKAGPAAAQPAVLAPVRPKLVALVVIDELEPTPPPVFLGHERCAVASARGPPTVAA